MKGGLGNCNRLMSPQQIHSKERETPPMKAPFWLHWLLLVFAISARIHAQEQRSEPAGKHGAVEPQSKVLTPDEWRRLDSAINLALEWLIGQQRPDGSFPTLERGQPGVTSLCVLAFMAHGHSAGEGKYGQQLDRATNYIIACQKQNGLITRLGLEGPRITPDVANEIGEPAAYNHAIGSLTLSEMYGMGQPKRAAQLKFFSTARPLSVRSIPVRSKCSSPESATRCDMPSSPAFV